MLSKLGFLVHRGQKEVPREEQSEEVVLEKLQKQWTTHLSQLGLAVRYKDAKLGKGGYSLSIGKSRFV